MRDADGGSFPGFLEKRLNDRAEFIDRNDAFILIPVDEERGCGSDAKLPARRCDLVNVVQQGLIGKTAAKIHGQKLGDIWPGSYAPAGSGVLAAGSR